MKSICIFIAFQSFYFGVRWVHALEFWIQVLPIYTIFSRFFPRKLHFVHKFVKNESKFQARAPNARQNKDVKNYKNEDANCTINRDHSLKLSKFIPVEQPVRNEFWSKNQDCDFLDFFENLESRVEKLFGLISWIF